MNIRQEFSKLEPDLVVWLVRSGILQYLRGLEVALSRMGDHDHSAFRDMVRGYMDIRKSDEYRLNMLISNAPDYRGLICVVMDDMGISDHDLRDHILAKLTGVSREEEQETYRLHRISQGDFWLKKEGE